MDYRVQKVILLIREDPSKLHTLSRLAHAVNISASRLRHLFKDEVGTTPTQYVKDLRMQIARELLESTSLRIKQVMMSVGVNDESHFIRDFKRTFGMSPTQCRTLHRTALMKQPVSWAGSVEETK